MVLLIQGLTSLGRSIISFARQRIAEEVALLNDPTVVKTIVPNEDGSVRVDLFPVGATEQTSVLVTQSQISGLAKTQQVINRVSGIFPNSTHPFINQLIRSIIELTLLGARAAEARKIISPPPPPVAKPLPPVAEEGLR